MSAIDRAGIEHPKPLAEFLSIKEVCQRSGLSRSFIAQRLSSGEIESIKKGRRRLIAVSSYNKFFGER
ncbi:MAG: helix-turn-helix domain-containing protein [Actinomycetes bacterium]